MPATPVQAQVQPSPQLVRFSSPHQVGYQPVAQYQPATKYQPGYSENQPQSLLPATPVQAQVHHPPQLVGYPSQYQPTSRYQPTSQYQSMSQYQPKSPYQPKSQYQPIRQYQPMAKHQPTAQYQPNQFPVQRQVPNRRKTTESDPPVNAYTCKSYDDYDTDFCSDEEDDKSEGYLQDTIKTKQNISPYSSIYSTDSGLIPRNEFPQSGTSTPGLTEVARQMSKKSDEMSTLCSNVSDLTSGIKNMLREIDNGALQRSSCFTCGSPHHMAKECPSRLSRDPQERAVRQSAKSQQDEEVGQILAPVKHGQKIRQTKIRNVIQSQQLVTKGQQNKQIAVSPQLETSACTNFLKQEVMTSTL